MGVNSFKTFFFKGADVSGELTLNEDLTWIKVMRDSKIDRSFGVCFNDGHVTGGGEGGGGRFSCQSRTSVHMKGKPCILWALISSWDSTRCLRRLFFM